MRVLDFDYVRNLGITPKQVYEWCNDVWRIKPDCVLPAKMKMFPGNGARYITMPCVIPPLGIAGVKFISRNLYDASAPPARNSNIIVQDIEKMGLAGVVDGIWITNMRTGAVAAHSVLTCCKSDAATLGLMGLGLTARAFLVMLDANADRPFEVRLLRYKDQAERILERFEGTCENLTFTVVDTVEEICSSDVVVSAVSYADDLIAPDEMYAPGCTVAPIHMGGFWNCDLFFDRVVIDDHAHAKSFRYYNQFEPRAVEMSDVVRGVAPGRENDEQRVVVYCGGIALHDLYIAAKVLDVAAQRGDAPDVPMSAPSERFWI